MKSVIFVTVISLITSFVTYPQENDNKQVQEGIKIEIQAKEEQNGYRIVASGQANLPDRTIVLLTIDKDWKVKLDDNEVMKEIRDWYGNLGVENKLYWRMNVSDGKFKMDKPNFPKHHLWAGDYIVKAVVKKWDQYFNLREIITEEQYNYVGKAILKVGNTGEISGYMKAEIPRIMNYYEDGGKLLKEIENVVDKSSKKIKDKAKGKELLEKLENLVRDLMMYQTSAHGPYNKARLRYSTDKLYNVFSILAGELSQELNPPPGMGGGQSRGVDVEKAVKDFESSKEVLCHEFFFLQRVEELKLLKDNWSILLSTDPNTEEYRRKLRQVKDGLTNIRGAHTAMEKIDTPFNSEPYRKLAEREKNLKYDLDIMSELIELLEKERKLSEEGKQLDAKDKARSNELLSRLKERLAEEKERELKKEEKPPVEEEKEPPKPPEPKPEEPKPVEEEGE